MKDFTVTRYSFDELTEGARARAIKTVQEQLLEDADYWLEDSMLDKLGQELGSEDTNGLKVRYSLGYSQGDGASFIGSITPAQAPALNFPEGIQYVDIIATTHHYCHYNTIAPAFFYEDNEPWSAPTPAQYEQEKVFHEQIKSICKTLSSYGYKCLEGDTSEEAATAYILDNYGDDFTANGTFDPLEVKVSA